MEEEKEMEEQEGTGGNYVYYVVGALLLVLVVGLGYMFRPKSTSMTSNQSPVPSPKPSPITGLACEKQYYNPVLGLPKYYLSVEGADLPPATKVTCDFSISVLGKTEATTSAESGMQPASDRGGNTFRCNTTPLALTPNVPTKVDVSVKDDSNNTIACTASFILPPP